MKKIDLTGKKFTRLTVLKQGNKKSKRGEIFWFCSCSCGKFKEIQGLSLRNGITRSCGCLRNELAKNKKHKSPNDITGQKFGRLTVLNSQGFIKCGKQIKRVWKCQCDCGNIVNVWYGSLTNNHTKSCGCLQREKVQITGKNNINENLNLYETVFANYKRRAKIKKINFLLEFDNFKNLLLQNCFYCDIFPKRMFTNKNKTKNIIINGIDRLDSNKGYTVENCVTCCKQCNWAKGSSSFCEFIGWAKRIYLYSINKDLINVNI